MNQEFSIKIKRVRSLLEELKLDAIYLKRQDNFAWLTCGGINYVSIGDMGNCGLLITMDKLYAITNVIEFSRMRDEEQLEELGFLIYYSDWYDNEFEASKIKSLSGSDRVGFDYPGPFGTNIGEDVKKQRFSLTEDEIERYKKLGYIASLAIEEIASSIQPGETEIQVASRLTHLLSKYNIAPVTLMCAADERIINYRHPISTSKVIKERVQLGGNLRYKGLIVGCTRLVNFTPITEELQDQYQKNIEIDCIMMNNTIPGKSYQVPLLAGKNAYKERGFEDEFIKHHQGGTIGYQPRDYRIDFSHVDNILENQAFCWNPSITGTKSEDTIMTTSDGIEMITKPIIFPTIDIEVNGVNYKRAAILQK